MAAGSAVLLAPAAALSVLLLSIFLFLSAGPAGGHQEKELLRVTSPDGTVDAVLWSVSGGGAAGYAYEHLYLTPAGEPAEEGELVLTPKSYPEGGLHLRWRDGSTLEAGPRYAPPRALTGTYHPKEVSGRRYYVEWRAPPKSELPYDAESTP